MVAVAVGQQLATLQLAELGVRDVVVEVVREDAWLERKRGRTLLVGVVVEQRASIALLQPCLATPVAYASTTLSISFIAITRLSTVKLRDLYRSYYFTQLTDDLYFRSISTL